MVCTSSDWSEDFLIAVNNDTKCSHLFTSTDILYSGTVTDKRLGEKSEFDIRANLHSEFKFACFWNQIQKNQNKRSHNTEIAMPQAFINSRSELEKGSHKRPYVTVSNSLSGGYLEKSKSKARRHSAGQCVNGALAGEQVSNLPVRAQ